MVSYEVRHNLGEYYTPDWLARYIATEKIDIGPEDSVLDPGCGSGTFLVEAIQAKRRTSTKPAGELVTSIAEEVVGIDIHPLAVMVAKANYVAAIRELLPYRRERIQIPVYLANSVLFSDRFKETEPLDEIDRRGPIEIAGEEYYLPQKAVENPPKLDHALDLLEENLHDSEAFEQRLSEKIPEFDELIPVFERIRNKLSIAESNERNSIHIFILKNFFRPFYLSDGKPFDVLIGNPPWVIYRYMQKNQQELLKPLLQDYDLHPGPQNVSNMELATLFVVRCADLYLRDGEKLGYVMPRAIFAANQHHKFRRGEFTISLELDVILDLEGVTPLFNVPASGIIATKRDGIEYPVTEETVSGKLGEKNASWEIAREVLDIESGEIFLQGEEVSSWDELPDLSRSEYHSEFAKGADITPRPLWFVDLQEETEQFGYNENRPPVITSDYAYNSTKREEYEVRLEEEIESDFLYATLLGGDVTPFIYRQPRPIALPIKPTSSGFSLLTTDQLNAAGYRGMENWMLKAERVYSRTEGQVDSLSEWIDYMNKISRQDPNKRFKVIYPTSATNIASCVVDTEELCGELDLRAERFVADMKTLYYETDDKNEAYYLSAILNSNKINDLIKNLQTRGDFGPRDIVKAPFEFPIPLYDRTEESHRELVRLGKKSEKEGEKALAEAERNYKAVWKIRELVKEALDEELKSIDEIVERLLQTHK
jgi:SAM-dependent methyltransferase